MANKRVRFYVRPMNCFGKGGAAICSDWISTEAETHQLRKVGLLRAGVFKSLVVYSP